MTDPALPHDVDPEVWAREGVNRFVRADGCTIVGIGRGQWCATILLETLDGATFIKTKKFAETKRGSARKFPSAGAAARFLALHHPLKGTSND